MEELLQYEKRIRIELEKETKRLLVLGYSLEQIKLLDEALTCFSYPLIKEYYENPQLFSEINNEAEI